MMSLPQDQQQPTFEDLRLLAEVSQLLTVLDLDSVMERVIKLMATAVGATKASLFLQGKDDIDWNHIFLMRDLKPDESVLVVRRVMDEGLAGWVVRQRQGTIVYDTQTDDRWHVFPDDHIPVRSVLCVPFVVGEDVLAVLTLVHPEPGHFTDHHLRMMTIVANHATVAIRNAQLFNQMQAQQQQLEAVLQAIPDALLVLDDQGYVLLLNTPALRFLGVESQREAVGKRITDFRTVDNTLNPIQEIVSNPLQSGSNQIFEIRSEKFSQDFLITATVWEDSPQDTAGYVVVMRDITTLRDLSRFKGEMLQVATHDLRSPLALIVGYCDLIGMEIPPERATAREYLNVIRRSTDRMNSLLDALLRAEQVRNSPLELHEHIKVQELVHRVLAAMTPAAEQKEIDIQSQIDVDESVEIVGDSILIQEAMTNFISNAVKYTPPGGHIVVDASARNGRFNFTVEDDGIGIPDEHIPHLFEAFYRAKQSGAEKIEGAGLGLNIVKTVIERHKGEVWVESQEGVGSRFGFWIPL